MDCRSVLNSVCDSGYRLSWSDIYCLDMTCPSGLQSVCNDISTYAGWRVRMSGKDLHSDLSSEITLKWHLVCLNFISRHLLCWASEGGATNSPLYVLYMGISYRRERAHGTWNSTHEIQWISPERVAFIENRCIARDYFWLFWKKNTGIVSMTVHHWHLAQPLNCIHPVV